MSKRSELEGRWALVTGASSGLGVDFARELASRKAKVVLVARREERLREVSEELQRKHGVETEVVAMDLAHDAAPLELASRLDERGIDVDVLVNNAGFGMHGRAIELDWERERSMIELDVLTLVQMTKIFGGRMAERGYGRILQVASIAAFQPSPTYASYAAAKAFVLNYGEAVNHELRGTGVTCTVVSPGMTATEFLDVAGQKPNLYQRAFMMTSQQVARIGVRATLHGRASIITGFFNAANTWMLRFSPRALVPHVVAAAVR